MVPLDVTHTVLCTKEIVQKFIDMDTKLTKDIAGFLLFFADSYFKLYKMVGAPLHDPCAVAYVIDRGIFESALVNVEVEKGDGYCVGRTVCDMFGVSGRVANVNVCTKICYEGFWDLIFGAVGRANESSKYGVRMGKAMEGEGGLSVESLKI